MPLRQYPAPESRRPWRPDRRALTAIALALIVAITVVDVLAPPQIHLGPLLVVAPALAASFSGTRATTVVAVLAVAAQVVIAASRDGFFDPNHETQIGALVLISTLIVGLRALRDRYERRLAQVRTVSEAAQRVLLRPLPERIGPLHLSSVYLAAEAEAQVGGDLYAAARTATGTRLLVGDVRGKGLASLGEAALLLGAFRAAAHLHATLPGLAAYLDGSVCWDLSQPRNPPSGSGPSGGAGGGGGGGGGAGGGGDGDGAGGGGDGDGLDEAPGESFITAVVLDIPDDGSVVRLIDCGHPPPLLLPADDGRAVSALVSQHPAPPLGLGELAPGGYRVEVFPFVPGDRLLIYTDGVIEARNGNRSFYPLTERIAGWRAEPRGALLPHLRRDLLAHVGGRLDDDAAMVLVERLPD
ncbi:PP2C family protein-serine/threonine phosphatase [Kitasatospora sp. NPDC054939]